MKYSIIIPTYNGLQYLPTCLETIISQNYEDYEIIVSDDHSVDGTAEYIDTLSSPHITALHCPEKVSMAEHWEWALSHATGEWLIFVGQDDGLQAYFFAQCDKLIEIATKKNIRSIMSQRAYFYWKGCEEFYGDTAVLYSAVKGFQIKNVFIEGLKTICGLQQYFVLPEMYTTSIFHKSLIIEAKDKQNGKLFVTHPQDANLAAIVSSLEKKYLYSNIPLGWVGSSPKSAGMAIVSKQKRQEELKDDYLEKTLKSELKYSQYVGSFSFASLTLYFWGALLETFPLRNKKNGFFDLPIIKMCALSAVKKEVETIGSGCYGKVIEYLEILKKNNISIGQISLFQLLVFNNVRFMYNLTTTSSRIIRKILSKILRKLFPSLLCGVHIEYSWTDNNNIGLMSINKLIISNADCVELLR